MNFLFHRLKFFYFIQQSICLFFLLIITSSYPSKNCQSPSLTLTQTHTNYLSSKVLSIQNLSAFSSLAPSIFSCTTCSPSYPHHFSIHFLFIYTFSSTPVSYLVLLISGIDSFDEVFCFIASSCLQSLEKARNRCLLW